MTTDRVLPVTHPHLTTMRIGHLQTCTALLPAAHLVRFECGKPTTHVRLVERTDGTRSWRSVCAVHSGGDLA